MSAAVHSITAYEHQVRRVARVGAVEATTYLALVVTTLWRAALGGPDLQRVMGLTHGIVFLVYAASVLVTRERVGWSSHTTVSLLIASVVPGGGFVVPRRLLRPQPGHR